MALKLVSIERDRDGQQVLEAEQWGAKLQEEFCRASRYVPAVFEHGTQGQYFFIAMEHLAGRNLSEVIGEGPLPAERAVRIAMQLCEFLEDAASVRGDARRAHVQPLLHGDLKPRNIRVLDGDEIKVFDFGIAKALSLSRKVTRNDFGSIAYLSPERLGVGEIDAQAELWAVGVLLYEMVGGVQPFRAAGYAAARTADPRAPRAGGARQRLSRRVCKAIIAKLLASDVADRYRSAVEIRDDLLRFSAGGEVVALREGWPDRQRDEGATRRTERPAPIAQIEEVTRRTVREALPAAPAPSAPVPVAAPSATAPAPPARAVPPAVAVHAPVSAAPVSAPAAAPPRRRGRVRRFVRKALVAIALIMVLNEIRVYVDRGGAGTERAAGRRRADSDVGAVSRT